jgi:hypothetical protein
MVFQINQNSRQPHSHPGLSIKIASSLISLVQFVTISHNIQQSLFGVKLAIQRQIIYNVLNGVRTQAVGPWRFKVDVREVDMKMVVGRLVVQVDTQLARWDTKLLLYSTLQNTHTQTAIHIFI